MIGRRPWKRTTSVVVLAATYVGALALGYLVAETLVDHGVLWALLAGDAAATLVVFLVAWSLSNTSVYDPYWSVIPVFLALWWHAHPDGGVRAEPWRIGLVLAVLALWGARLTGNFLRGWSGLNHEDWRYTAYRRFGPVRYWLISLVGLQMMPTLLVFGGMLPVYALTRDGGAGPNWLDWTALVVCLLAIVLEAAADEQRRRFAAADRDGFIQTGLWAWSRHPNYLGEITLWWGILLFGLAAAGDNWWTGAGAVAMTALFWFISIPLMERRMRERRPGFAAYADRVPRLFPRVPR